jgi:hypothetical protein
MHKHMLNLFTLTREKLGTKVFISPSLLLLLLLGQQLIATAHKCITNLD